MGIANSRGVLQGTRGRAGAQRVQRLVWTPVRAHGAAARVAHLSASTWPAQHPAAAPHTPSSARRGARVDTRDARERTSHGPRSATRPLPAGRDGQGQAARWVSAADAHARWACEDESDGEAEVDVSVKEGRG